jgi:hypothetical protein
MKKIGVFAVGALVAAVLAPSALAAPAPNAGDRARAVQDCKTLRAQLGKQTFRATYGTANVNRKNAFARCFRQWSAEEAENRVEARAECLEEQGTTPESRQAFREQYGRFGSCVAQKRRAESRQDRRDVMNAARACKAERGTNEESRAAFRAKYGGNANAFGKCVSTLAKAQDEGEDEEG